MNSLRIVYNLFPVEIELPQVIHGRYSQSKLVELERERNFEVLEPDEEFQNDEREMKTIPLEYVSDEENDNFEDNEESNEGNNNEEDESYNHEEENVVNNLPSSSQICTTPRLHYGYLPPSNQPSGLKSILKNSRSRERSVYIGTERSTPTFQTTSKYSRTNNDADDESDDLEEIECVKYIKKPRSSPPPSPTGSEVDLAIAYKNNLSG
uniref:Candidate secreted effector n=1 Tax=Meloidogyne incognita TaxID=6306 RepID=A0A914NHV7_MELIC